MQIHFLLWAAALMAEMDWLILSEARGRQDFKQFWQQGDIIRRRISMEATLMMQAERCCAPKISWLATHFKYCPSKAWPSV